MNSLKLKRQLESNFKLKGYFTNAELKQWHEATGFKGLTPEEKLINNLNK